MSLQEWANSGWLRRHRTSRQEISGLWGIIDRDLVDAGPDSGPAGPVVAGRLRLSWMSIRSACDAEPPPGTTGLVIGTRELLDRRSPSNLARESVWKLAG